MEKLDILNVRKNFITKYIREKYKSIYSEKELILLIDDTINKLSDKEIATTQYKEDIIVNYNNAITKNMNEIYYDIGTIYEYINLIDKKVNDSLDSSYSVINKLESDIVKANEIINEYEAFIKSKGNPVNKIELFSNKNNFETDLNIYCERYGEKIGVFSTNIYEESTSSLILPKLRTQNMAHYSEGVIAAKVYVNRQYSSANKEKYNNDDNISNILIPNSKNIWEENIYTDEPIKINEKTKHYEINCGALCEIVIDFESITVLNELKIVPFGKYPVDILEIKYSSTGASDEELKHIVTNLNTEEGLKPKSLDKTIIYRFPNILVKKVYIAFNQLHYIRDAFIYNSNNVLKNNILYTLKNKENQNLNLHEDTLYKPNYNDREDINVVWALINESSKYNEIKLEDLLFSVGKYKKAIKYHYNYGINTIAPCINEFDRIGVYVSKPISGVGNIKNVSITTNEFHMLNMNGNQTTDIEYYLTCANSPRWNDWIPILPTNKVYIKCELLQLYDDICYLRFPGKITRITCDDNLLNKDVDYFEKIDSNNNVYAIEIPDFDFASIYVAEYTPCKESTIVDFSNNDKVSSMEQFEGKNQSFFILKNNTHLFTDEENTNSTYVKIIDANTGKVIASENNGIKCVTDVYNSYDSYKNFRQGTSDYEYYTCQNYLYFNKALKENYRIEIIYKHFINQIRLKAIIRRNTKSDKYITPVLDSIEYKITTAN